VLVLVNVNMHVNECYMQSPWSQYPGSLRHRRNHELAIGVTQPEAVRHALGMVLLSLCLGVSVRKQKTGSPSGKPV
jgi:hypothetical protein